MVNEGLVPSPGEEEKRKKAILKLKEVFLGFMNMNFYTYRGFQLLYVLY